jgi:hypothetical protein
LYVKITVDDGLISREACLYLVIPSIRTRPHLHAPNKTISTTQEVSAKFRQPIWRSVIQAHDEQRLIDDAEACSVTTFSREGGAQAGPHFSILGGENTKRISSDLGCWQFVRIGDNRLQVPKDLTFGKKWTVVLIQDVKPIWVIVSGYID